MLLGCTVSVHADEAAQDPGTCLSAQLGGGRIAGGNASGNRWMRSRAGELRIGRAFGASPDSRVDVVYYNEGHPDNKHRDGYALQWTRIWREGELLSGEFGIGPYFTMNTTRIDGRQLDDDRWGVLLSAALRVRGVSAGTAVTSMPGTNTGGSAILDAGRDIDHGAAHWGWSARFLFEGDDGSRVDRRGVAGQLWYVQEVTPGFSMRAGIGPYLTRNRREQPVPDRARRNVLISLQAERALSDRTRIFFDFGRVKTFLRMDDRDLFLVGKRKRF